MAMVLFLGASFAIGFLGGGASTEVRSVVGLGSAQRNLSAALVVAGQKPADTPGVVTFIIVAGIVGLILLLPAAGELGRRAQPSLAS